MDRSARFYEYHAAMMEPGRAGGCRFTDGRQIGATLDRNGCAGTLYRHE